VKPADGMLDHVSAVVSDGGSVDWEACEQQASTERQKRCIRNLRLVSAVGRLARDEALLPAAGAAAGTAGDAETVITDPAAVPAAGLRDDLPCETWGHLKLLERIGTGGFAEVYRAWDDRLHRQVALKLLRSDRPSDPESESRFLDEARLLARVEHPHVVRIYGVESHAGRTGIWMELVSGSSLLEWVEDHGPLGADEAARTGIALCGALAAIHAAHVIHQDIKPHNVLRDTNARIVLMDFGAGRSRRAGVGSATTGLVGTPRYMAPELFEGSPPSPQSDLYSLGLLLCYLVTGEHPADRARRGEPGDAGRRSGPGEAARQSGSEPVRLAELQPELPASFTAVVDRALAHDRSVRFRSAAEMQRQLEAALASMTTAAGGEVEARGAAAPQQGASRPPVMSFWRLAPIMAGVALVTVAGILWMAHRAAHGPFAVQVEFIATSDRSSRILAENDPVSAQDQIELRLDLSRPAWVYVLNRDDAGQLVLLFPMAGGGARNPLAARQRHVLPGTVQGGRMGWTLSADRGVERFLVVASPERLAEFEDATAEIPAVAIGGGLTVTPVGDVASDLLLRSVTGMAAIPQNQGARRPDLFDLARKLEAERKSSGDIWLQELDLQNRGP
jgi:tRNA A-37 threonylcarbamoyl transferase component Bud32